MKTENRSETFFAARDFQKRQRVAEIDDETGRFVSYLDEGEPAKPAVVFLHGIPTWGFLFHRQIPQLTGTHRVLVPDLPGFGYSDKRDSFDRSLAAQTTNIIAWLDRINVEKARFVAHDIGGGIALRLATLYPARVEKLFLMNSVCYDSFPIEAFLQLGSPASRKTFSPAAFHKTLKKMLTENFAHSPGDELLENIAAPYQSETGKTSMIRNANSLNCNHTLEITRRLSQIRIPTFIVWGEDDVFLDVKWGARLASDISGAKFIRVKDARHFVMLDQAEEINRHLTSFLAG